MTKDNGSRCLLCGRSAAMVSYVKAGCRYRRCRCGTLYQEHPPTPAQLRHLYQSYHEKEYGTADDYRSAMEPFFRSAAPEAPRGAEGAEDVSNFTVSSFMWSLRLAMGSVLRI